MAAPIGPKKVHRYTIEFKIQGSAVIAASGDPDAGCGAGAGYPSVHALEVEEGLSSIVSPAFFLGVLAAPKQKPRHPHP